MHSPEPWTVCDDDGSGATIRDGSGKYDDGGDWVLQASVNHDGFCSSADARRIVACVNFLQGVPTEELERWAGKRVSIREGDNILQYLTAEETDTDSIVVPSLHGRPVLHIE